MQHGSQGLFPVLGPLIGQTGLQEVPKVASEAPEQESLSCMDDPAQISMEAALFEDTVTQQLLLPRLKASLS